MRTTRTALNDGGLTRVVVLLAALFASPIIVGLGFSRVAPGAQDTALLFGILGALIAPSCFLFVCFLGSLIPGLLGD